MPGQGRAGSNAATARRESSANLSPSVLHGTWLPDERGGRFLIWGEAALGTGRPLPHEKDHPFHLHGKSLDALLSYAWPGLDDFGPPADSPGKAWVVLPGNGARPSPSLDLQADIEGDAGEPTCWGIWRVDVLEAKDPLAVLGCLASRPTRGADTIRVGQDLRFWQGLAERLVWAVRRHEYLPAIHVEARGKRERRKKTGGAPPWRFRAGWELAQYAEERIVGTLARAMPGSCAAMWLDEPPDAGDGPAMRDSNALLHHFLTSNLQHLIQRTRFTLDLMRRVEDSFVAKALPRMAHERVSGFGAVQPIGESTWMQWARWRNRIQRSSRDADECVCFRLADAKGDSPDAWHLEWLLSSRSDPSLLVPLADFWHQNSVARPSSVRIREVLIQLGQAARLYDRLWEGMESPAPSGVVLDRDDALDFLRQQAPMLQGAGFRVIVPAWWTSAGRRRLRVRLTTQGSGGQGEAGSESSGLLGFDSIVKLTPQVVLDGEPLEPLEWERIVAAKEGLVEIRGQWMELQSDDVARLEEYWESGGEPQSTTVADLLRMEADADESGMEVVYRDGVGQLLAGLRNRDGLQELAQPASFVGRLRDYQVRGFSWLAYLESLGLGACLADDMGLGKTIQVLALVLEDQARDPGSGATLLIAPTSVLGNWQREAARFAPSLECRIHHGPKRVKGVADFKTWIAGADLVIVSFGVARLDVATLSAVAWHRLVVDEAQNAKNPIAAVTKAIRRFKARRRIALTGTPVENRLMDLWSLFSLINPGYLGTVTAFRENVERPIMREKDRAVTRRLRGMVQPFILRRMKTDRAIIKDLPDKVEQKAFCNLTPEQATLYEAVLRKVERDLEKAEGFGGRGLMLGALVKLKQVCNHPAQFLQDGSKFAESRSHKLARVCEMLDEIESENESALVFTQFAELGRMLELLFRRRYGGAVYYLHGGTSRVRREHMVEEFQNPDTERAIFVLSLRAGGTGLTLTRANHVIHFDRWWNPAVENQASDRAYRIGQEKRVFVHKMVTMGTLDERIDELIESKKQLAEDIVGSDESWLASLDIDVFRKLVALDRTSAVVG